MSDHLLDRREFLSAFALLSAGAWLEPRDHGLDLSRSPDSLCGAQRIRAASVLVHPTPRKGITAAKVLASSELASRPDLQDIFDGIRAIPAIADGIRCSCGCAELPGYYSLLSCYEGEAMAKICPICQGAGRLTVRLHAEGQTLAQIRVAVDAQFG